ncbi:hypothetical protein B4098_0327 [Heyndrickxia coagulans]|uniref:Uncharacterized protein n=1 Tax=Heyndrickxia coagulans TaxID=1398 RepID=A0A150JUM7_HEYCO|nr:hypothetical protein B4098_0327 [Heyndrickxia coagulans]
MRHFFTGKFLKLMRGIARSRLRFFVFVFHLPYEGHFNILGHMFCLSSSR